MKALKLLALTLLLLAFQLGFAAETQEAPQPLAKPYYTTDLISLQPLQDREIQSFELTVRGPEGLVLQQSFNGNSVPFIELYNAAGKVLADGQYAFELRGIPFISQEGYSALQKARESGDESQLQALREKGILPEVVPVQSGYFRIENGLIQIPGAIEPRPVLVSKAEHGRSDNATPGDSVSPNDEAGSGDVGSDDRDNRRDQIINDDLIVTGSACVGFDCVNGEVFGFDTIRLKENNLRIKFMDTSVSGFPSVDWQLTANDSASGGANKFSIDDIDGGRTPFTVEANARTHALYVDDGGRVGFGTSTPSVDLHMVRGNTPTLRLQQDGTSGFAPQTWDIAGNETSFFVRDATNGSALPFRIFPASSSSVLNIKGNSVGINDVTPDATLDVQNGWMRITDTTPRVVASGEASFLVEQTTASAAHVLMRLVNEGSVNFLFEDSAANVIWKMLMNGGNGTNSSFQISRDGSGVNELTLSHNGNLTVTGSITASCGTLTCASDRNLKENFQDIDPNEILSKVLAMPVTQWNYKRDEDELRHIGPVAQDFYAAFGVGVDDKSISVTDTAGVAFGAIQGLYRVIESKDNEINNLKQQMATQEARLKALEDALLK